ncbi:hypothetical protein KA996_12900 [bacterium]|nr:hypothetical protein [bacterium]
MLKKEEMRDVVINKSRPNIYFKKTIIHALEQYRKSWELGNSVLYNLCRKHPTHKTEGEVLAKIWLIGRSYAAALERRKNKEKESSSDDFYNNAADQIQQSEIDKWIEESRNNNDPEVHIKTHKEVTTLFETITGLEKRSLASKYLHFHLPKKFFIYDSRAAGAMPALLRELGIKKVTVTHKGKEYDEKYASFYEKCLVAQKAIKEKFNINCSCRDLDTVLIHFDKIKKTLNIKGWQL